MVIRAAYDKVLESFDVLVTPTLPTTAPLLLPADHSLKGNLEYIPLTL